MIRGLIFAAGAAFVSMTATAQAADDLWRSQLEVGMFDVFHKANSASFDLQLRPGWRLWDFGVMAGGMVMRQDDPRDRRSVIVRLTRKGRESFLRMARRHEEWVVSILGDLSVEAQSELLQNLTLLQRNLDMHGKV